MKTDPNQKNNPEGFSPSSDDFLRIFLPMIDDEEQRRLEKLEEEEEEEWATKSSKSAKQD